MIHSRIKAVASVCLFAVATAALHSSMYAAGLTEESIRFSCLKPASITAPQNERLKDYCSALMHTVRQHWNPPKSGAGARTIAFTVGATGNISAIKLEQSSGIAIADKSAVEAVTKSAPFSSLPEGIQQISVELKFGGKWEHRLNEGEHM